MTATPKAAAPKKSAPKKVAKVEKKSKVTKPKSEKKAKTASSHPPFKQMVKKAIAELKEKGGSSRQAILKYVCANYKVDAKFGNKYVKAALINGVKNNSFKRVKGVGASGSFKLVEKAKKAAKPKKKKESKPKAKKSPAKKAAKPKAKKAVKRLSKPKAPKKTAAAKKPAKPKAKSAKKSKAAAPKKA